MSIVATGQLTILDINDGVPGPALTMTTTAQGYTFLDGVATPAQQYIGFQVVRHATSEPVKWFASNGATLSTDASLLPMGSYLAGLYGAGEGDVAYMTVGQLGADAQVVVTAVAGGLTATTAVVRLEKSTAAAGATVGATWGSNVGSIPTNIANAGASPGVSLLNSNITLSDAGTLSGAGGGSVTIGGLGYTGALNATANVLTSGTLAARPTGANGDSYFATDNQLLYQKVAGVWSVSGNNYTNTNQLTDGAALGTTANWSGIPSGTGKPVDYATSNIITQGLFSARPTGANGDTFYATDTRELFQKVAGSWVLSSTLGASASNFTGSVGGGNLLAVGSFAQEYVLSKPLGWGFAGTVTSTGKSLQGGPVADGAYVTASVGSSGSAGILTSRAQLSALGGVRGGFAVGRKYVVSFYAKNSYNGGPVCSISSPAFSSYDAVSQPTLTSAWQRFVFRVTCTVANLDGELTIWNNNTSSVGGVSYGAVQVEEGDVLTAYSETTFGPITAGNVAAWVGAGAIGGTHVGVLTANNLTVAAVSNTINGSLSSGGRVEVSNNVIRVYDTSNVLRVKMGYLL